MPDEGELVKSGVQALIQPVADLISKLAGPAAEEIGLTLQDSIRVYRVQRQMRLLQKVSISAQECGFTPGEVPLKLLLPILDNASRISVASRRSPEHVEPGAEIRSARRGRFCPAYVLSCRHGSLPQLRLRVVYPTVEASWIMGTNFWFRASPIPLRCLRFTILSFSRVWNIGPVTEVAQVNANQGNFVRSR
jgi:hypothetical protein